MSRDLTWPEVTRTWRHLTGSRLEVSRRPRTGVLCSFGLLQGSSSQEGQLLMHIYYARSTLTLQFHPWKILELTWQKGWSGTTAVVNVLGVQLGGSVRITSHKEEQRNLTAATTASITEGSRGVKPSGTATPAKSFCATMAGMKRIASSCTTAVCTETPAHN